MKVYENGKPAKAIKGALVGEVWVTGGQSNMQFEARAMDGRQRGARRASGKSAVLRPGQRQDKRKAPPRLRWAGGVRVAGRDNLAHSNAVALFFGSRISKALRRLPSE